MKLILRRKRKSGATISIQNTLKYQLKSLILETEKDKGEYTELIKLRSIIKNSPLILFF